MKRNSGRGDAYPEERCEVNRRHLATDTKLAGLMGKKHVITDHSERPAQKLQGRICVQVFVQWGV